MEKNSLLDSVYTRWVKNLLRIVLSHNISEIIEFFVFYEEIQNGGKLFWEKMVSRICRYPEGKIFHQNTCILHRFRDKCVFCVFTQNFKMGAKYDRKMIIGSKISPKSFYLTPLLR